MCAEVLTLLKKLTETFGVSGYEMPVRRLIEQEISPFCDRVRTDSMGNLIAYRAAAKNSETAKTVLLSAHMDEVGFIVTGISDEGYLSFESVGGIDPKILISQKVGINGISGVISLKAVHLSSKDELKDGVKEEKLYIDIGAASRAEAEEIVMPGDYCEFDSEYVEFGDMIKAKALDDRVGCAIMIEMLKKPHDVNLYCTFTVQEEVGLRGAAAAVYGLHPDYAVVIESTTCSDMTGTPDNLCVTKSGGGAAISVLDSASHASAEVAKMLTDAARNSGIPYQLKASTAGGNDAGAIYLSNGGIKTASISVPCRYIHSPVCVMNKNDYKSCGDIVAAFLNNCGKDAVVNG